MAFLEPSTDLRWKDRFLVTRQISRVAKMDPWTSISAQKVTVEEWTFLGLAILSPTPPTLVLYSLAQVPQLLVRWLRFFLDTYTLVFIIFCVFKGFIGFRCRHITLNIKFRWYTSCFIILNHVQNEFQSPCKSIFNILMLHHSGRKSLAIELT